MHIRNAARALLLAETLATFFAQTVEAQDRHQQLQFCWSVGTFDKTVYFAESLQLDSRLASFTEMLDISAIDHTAVECRYLNPDQRTKILRVWSEAHLEVINTTFMSDLDF